MAATARDILATTKIDGHDSVQLAAVSSITHWYGFPTLVDKCDAALTIRHVVSRAFFSPGKESQEPGIFSGVIVPVQKASEC